jgi:hypothetical protein
MRRISKTILRTCAGLAVAAGLVVGGAGVASAAPVTNTTNHFGPGCNPFAREMWNLNGSNEVQAVYLGTTYTYSVTFKQRGSCLTGTLTDSYYPTTGPITGTVYGNHVTFSFQYPAGSVQGTRFFNGYIKPQYYKQWYRQWYWNGYRWVLRWRFRLILQSGSVSGNWWETGSEHGSGTFSLASNVRPACPRWYGPNSSCFVF